MTPRKAKEDLLKVGRPTEYTEELASELCSRVALGESLKRITCADDMPSARSVYNWLGKYPEFVHKYTQSKCDSADSRADQVEEIAEKVLEGVYEPAAARVAIDAFKWTSGKHKPKKYGDRPEIQKETPGAVTKLVIEVVSASSHNSDETPS